MQKEKYKVNIYKAQLIKSELEMLNNQINITRRQQFETKSNPVEFNLISIRLLKLHEQKLDLMKQQAKR
jgi:hypothetical protein